MDTFAFPLMGKRWKLLFSDQLSHATCGRDISSGQGSQTSCVEITYLALGSDFLTVLVYQKDNASR
jgi:hypothetical protein